MGFISGGTADKLGNRYEGRWVVKQLLFLVAERIRSVQLEAIGDDEAGVDLWVERLDGTLEAHQCKAFNGSQNTWSIADLKQRNVLEKAISQLERSNNIGFKFVSTIVAAELEDLSRNARDSKSDAETFVQHFVQSLPREKQFKSFCRAIQLNPENIEDCVIAVDLLKRIECHLFADDRSTRDDLEFLTSMLFEGGTPTTAIAALAEIATDNLHKKLTAPEVVRLLEQYGFRSTSRSADPRIVDRLGALRQDFIDTIKPRLAAGELIQRPETQEIRELLFSSERFDAIVIHGIPGSGKSGILYELARDLDNSGVIVFVIRLDRQPPRTLSSLTYGRELGLPLSPVACLRDISASQPAVLIVDQLDALRWTNAHSSQGLAICKQMLREVQAARNLGAKIEIVFACRTFDLERDPEIRAWLSNEKSHLRIAKVEAKSLPSSVVRQLIKEKGLIEPDTLRSTQLRLLESVHHLALWLEIVRTEKTSPQFDSSTQLMRRFWNNRRQRLEESGTDPLRREAAIGSLVKYMENNACLSAPERLLAFEEKLKTELQTFGVISVHSGQVSFGHQSNLDFLVADAAVTRMAAESLTVLDWLGPLDRQSLFRREQLRQVLFLLADEQHEQFLETVQLLLEAPGVRFHLRQLALEALGQVLPKLETLNLVLNLLANPQWAEHIRYQVIYGNVEYIRAIHERGLLLGEMTSNNKRHWQQAAEWVYSVRVQSPHLVFEICTNVIRSTTDWIDRLSRIVGHDGVDIEPDELFSVRLKCLSGGSEPIYVQWSDFAKKHPKRALRLFNALIKGWIVRGAKWDRNRDDSHIYGRGSAPLVEAVNSFPGLAWKLLWPRLCWFIREQRKKRKAWLRANKMARHFPHRERLVVPRTLRAAVLESTKRLVGRDPEWWLSLAREPAIANSRYLTSLFVEILTRLPTKIANPAIEWLLSDTRRLHCGSGTRRHRWSESAKMIRRMSPHSSLELFKKLQQALLEFRDPAEKRLAEFWLSETKYGVFNNQFGAAQYHLLPALCPDRRSAEATSRLGVLQEKFAKTQKEAFFTRSRMQGGFVSSPIDSDRRYARMNDKSWMKLVLNKRVPLRRGRWLYPLGQKKGILESSVGTMSRSFGRAARLKPERFARLGLIFSVEVHANYISELLRALRETKPPEEVPEKERADWSQATPETIGMLLEVMPLTDDASCAQEFCWLLAQRDDIKISEPILERLLKFVDHEDPRPDQLKIDCDKRASDCSIDTLEANAINSARGTSALAIASILWRRIDLLARLQPFADKLLADAHPAVRVAATRFCGAVWKHDQHLAIKWLVAVATEDGRIAACHEVVRLYNSCFPKYANELVPIIRNMLNSPYMEVVEAGAAQVAARWLFCGLFREEFATCIGGSIAQRKGVADTFCQLVTDPDYAQACLPYIERFMNDDDEDVRHKLSRVVNNDGFFQLAWAPDFLVKFVRSKAGGDECDWLLWKLKDLQGSLDTFAEVILALSDITAEDFSRPVTSNQRYRDIDGLVHLLLRLYEGASGTNSASIRQKCLDIWDKLLQRRATVAWALTRGLDATGH